MKSPVVTVDGYAYEREAIEEWFKWGHTTSPLTGLQLPSLQLTPELTLGQAIDENMQQVVPEVQPVDLELLSTLAAQLQTALQCPEAALREAAMEVSECLAALVSSKSQPEAPGQTPQLPAHRL